MGREVSTLFPICKYHTNAVTAEPGGNKILNGKLSSIPTFYDSVTNIFSSTVNFHSLKCR